LYWLWSIAGKDNTFCVSKCPGFPWWNQKQSTIWIGHYVVEDTTTTIESQWCHTNSFIV
jgi:hypothetical protein